MSRICSVCGAAVARKDCHKNRYTEYICRKCQAAGIKFTRRGQLRYWMKWALPVFLLSLVIASLALLLMWPSLVTGSSFDFLGGERDAPTEAPSL